MASRAAGLQELEVLALGTKGSSVSKFLLKSNSESATVTGSERTELASASSLQAFKLKTRRRASQPNPKTRLSLTQSDVPSGSSVKVIHGPPAPVPQHHDERTPLTPFGTQWATEV